MFTIVCVRPLHKRKNDVKDAGTLKKEHKNCYFQPNKFFFRTGHPVQVSVMASTYNNSKLTGCFITQLAIASTLVRASGFM
ncbi:hypothetical protein CDAR_449841 [Caerostris darwini]|uniref:Uncharacterized protein n=1 Tax=Caerostris darwini TaxID=1538125 RepID=A0AAV4QUV9_9ARAC|nr:hypothetical protein CDAR_449841 [Caerostris darwini]